MSVHEAFVKVRRFVVKIETPAGAGTGFFFAYNEDKSIIAVATALHVVDDAERWRQPMRIIEVETGKEIFLAWADRVVFTDYERDSAAIMLSASAVGAAGLSLPESMLPILASTQYKKVGVELAWIGYPAIAPRTLCLFQGGVSAFNKADDSYFVDGVAINGVSGGPVFYEFGNKPEIVGIVSAYRYNWQQSGGSLPGLLVVHDATHLNTMVEQIKTMDEARKKAAAAASEQKEQQAQQPSVAPPGPGEPGTPAPTGPSSPPPGSAAAVAAGGLPPVLKGKPKKKA